MSTKHNRTKVNQASLVSSMRFPNCTGSLKVGIENCIKHNTNHFLSCQNQLFNTAYFSSSRRLSSSSRSLFTRSSRSRSSCINFSRSRRRFLIALSLRCFVRSKSTWTHKKYELLINIILYHYTNALISWYRTIIHMHCNEANIIKCL